MLAKTYSLVTFITRFQVLITLGLALYRRRLQSSFSITALISG